jgi:hypothetical protein
MAAVKSNKPTKAPSKKLKAGQKKKVSKWLILGGIAAVAGIGAVVIRYSGAAEYSFVHGYKQNSGGTANSRTGYRDFKSNGTISTLVSRDEARGTKQWCFHWKSLNGKSVKFAWKPTVQVGTASQYKKNYETVDVAKSGYECFTGYKVSSGAGFKVELVAVPVSGIGIDNLYGKP